VDARFNYYLPEDKQFETDRTTTHDSDTNVRPFGGGAFQGCSIKKHDLKRT